MRLNTHSRGLLRANQNAGNTTGISDPVTGGGCRGSDPESGVRTPIQPPLRERNTYGTSKIQSSSVRTPLGCSCLQLILACDVLVSILAVRS